MSPWSIIALCIVSFLLGVLSVEAARKEAVRADEKKQPKSLQERRQDCVDRVEALTILINTRNQLLRTLSAHHNWEGLFKERAEWKIEKGILERRLARLQDEPVPGAGQS